jgi:NDP-sugar pyrophosphorylase family protein
MASVTCSKLLRLIPQMGRSRAHHARFRMTPALRRTRVFRILGGVLKPDELFDLSQTEHAAIFDGCEHAWDALRRIKDYLSLRLEPELRNTAVGSVFVGEDVFIDEGTVVEEGAMIKGPAYIGRNCQIRHNAYIRENVIIGDDCVVGNACEFKNALLFNGCQVPHFNYVGDSILGHKAHLGAGVKISNVRIMPGNVQVAVDGQRIDSGLRKFGALLGDRAEVGCNAVLNPGSVIGRDAIVYPCVNWRGVLQANGIAKNRSTVEVETRKA